MLLGIIDFSAASGTQYPDDRRRQQFHSILQFPGADAETVQNSAVTQVIVTEYERLSITSQGTSSNGVPVRQPTVDLRIQSDTDFAQVQVQNKLALATPLLPQEVRQQGLALRNPAASRLVARRIPTAPNQDDIR